MDTIIIFFASVVVCLYVLNDMNKWSNDFDVNVELDELDRDNIN